MDSLDLAVLRALHGWRAEERHALLATVVRTWGSSPRPVGSLLALRDDGAVVGSVSGGCVEDDLIAHWAHAGRLRAHAVPLRVRYGVTADEAHRFGLPCGGTLEVLLEFNPGPDELASLLAALDAGGLVRRRVSLVDGAVTLTPTGAPAALVLDALALAATFGPGWRLLLIGAGALAGYLATMALFNGFAVTVCEPREEHRAAFAVPGAQLTHDMPDDAVRAFAPDARSCIVALSHDPKLDDLALLAALESEAAFYVGAIGSRRNQAARRERLTTHFDVPAAALARLRGPVGLPIGSKTPAEIAVSVMAEILALRNGVVFPN